jgi:hypothetical protein
MHFLKTVEWRNPPSVKHYIETKSERILKGPFATVEEAHRPKKANLWAYKRNLASHAREVSCVTQRLV